MQAIIEKAKNIRLLILDVDGVLTCGAVYYGHQGAEYRSFHVHDGFGMRLLQKKGIPIAIITAKESGAVTHRMNDLQVRYVYQGQENKLIAYEALQAQLKLTDAEIAYVGDDFPDLCILKRVGLSITVPEAPVIIQDHVHWVTKRHGGAGAVREVCDLILQAQNLYPTMVDSSYL